LNKWSVKQFILKQDGKEGCRETPFSVASVLKREKKKLA